MESSFYLPIFLIAGGIIFLIIFFHYVPFFLWLSAKVSGVNISLIQLFLMRIRNVPPYIIVPGMIEAHKAGLKNITRDELEAHYLAGGHVEKVVHALVSASAIGIYQCDRGDLFRADSRSDIRKYPADFKREKTKTGRRKESTHFPSLFVIYH